ncbi:hypothetical protein ALC60_06908 [Trachymyrmex zeteki]|uniref:Uncharacterized protein n=1 Tax=Mycetomoellerius zeteki TaxID=64791 RepID=A0A151X1S1_9HYME|nr:hypothetical protein ALC60_06908 [Trachymyrmex zeteki]
MEKIEYTFPRLWFKRNESNFLRRLITVDETWIHYFTPETKENNREKQWITFVKAYFAEQGESLRKVYRFKRRLC